MLVTIEEHTFLPPKGTVIDLGSSEGKFARGVTQRFDVPCIAVEPSRVLAERTGALNLAIGQDGEANLQVSDDNECSGLYGVASGTVLRTERVRTVTLATLLAEQGLEEVGLVKVDIEGAESLLFAEPADTLKRVAQFTVEFHDFVGYLTHEDVKQIVGRLRSIGFGALKVTRTNYNWLFYQPKRCGIRQPALLRAERHLRYVGRNVRRVVHQIDG